MTEVDEVERAYWAAWRMGWLHRLGLVTGATLLTLLVYSCVDDSGWARAKREERRVAYNDSLGAVRRKADYHTMGTWCRAKLRIAATAKDSAKILAKNVTYGFANENGFICENWILGDKR